MKRQFHARYVFDVLAVVGQKSTIPVINKEPAKVPFRPIRSSANIPDKVAFGIPTTATIIVFLYVSETLNLPLAEPLFSR